MSNHVAITVNSPGAVTIDLNGHSLTANPLAFIPELYLNPVGILILGSNVTVKSGTVGGFFSTIDAGAPFNNNTIPNYLVNSSIEYVTFTGAGSVRLVDLNSSIVRDCVFNAPFLSVV
jgi:hypothetical protein